MTGYHAYGLRIASAVPLPLPEGPVDAPDLVLRRGADGPVPATRPEGTRLAEVCRADRTVFYTLARGTRTVLRYPGLCDVVGDRDFRDLTVHRDPAADEGMLPVLIAGTVLAVHLMLRPSLVLHASAVQVGESALAFVGSSGMGKSTLAAALCALGCGLVSDDLLRVDRVADRMVTHPGGTESRLRPSARELAATGDAYETADGRLASRPRTSVAGTLPLAACVVPRPRKDVTTVTAARLRPSAALLRLSRYPRVLGWTDGASMGHAFQSLADLVERVPVYEATIPWGLPFADGVLTSLLDAVAGRQPGLLQ